jgi:hypothetical protein
MKVRNVTSDRSMQAVRNQFLVTDDSGNEYFQSYETIIIKWTPGKTYLDRNSWDCSVTTGKYRNQLLGETKKETERKI